MMGRPIRDATLKIRLLEASLREALAACQERHEKEKEREQKRRKLRRRLPDYVDLVGLFTGQYGVDLVDASKGSGEILSEEEERRLRHALGR